MLFWKRLIILRYSNRNLVKPLRSYTFLHFPEWIHVQRLRIGQKRRKSKSGRKYGIINTVLELIRGSYKAEIRIEW